MEKFAEIRFAIFYLVAIGVIHNVSGECRKLLIHCHASFRDSRWETIFFLLAHF